GEEIKRARHIDRYKHTRTNTQGSQVMRQLIRLNVYFLVGYLFSPAKSCQCERRTFSLNFKELVNTHSVIFHSVWPHLSGKTMVHATSSSFVFGILITSGGNAVVGVF